MTPTFRSYRDSPAYRRSNRVRPDGTGFVFPYRPNEISLAHKQAAG